MGLLYHEWGLGVNEIGGVILEKIYFLVVLVDFCFDSFFPLHYFVYDTEKQLIEAQ